MTKCIVLCLNALAKLQNPKEVSRHPALMGNCSTCSHMPWPYQSTKWFVISLFQVVCDVWDSVARREVSVDKKVELKFIQVNALKNIARMTRRLYGLSILEWIYTLQLLECQGTTCSKQTRYLTFKWLQRDSNPQPRSL